MKKKLIVAISVVLVMALMTAVLVACVPEDPADLKAKLEEKGYTVLEDSGLSGVIGGLFDSGVSSTLIARKDDQSVTVVYYEDADKAKAAHEEMKEEYEDAKEEIKELKAEAKKLEGEEKEEALEQIKKLEEALESTKFGLSGKALYFGTPDAVKDILF